MTQVVAAGHRHALDLRPDRRRGQPDRHLLLAGRPGEPAAPVRAVQLRHHPGRQRRRPRARRRRALRHLGRVGARRHRHPGHLGAAAGRAADTLLSCTPASPGVLQENGDQATWGTLVLAAPAGPGLTWQIGAGHRRARRVGGQGALGEHQRHRASRARSTTAGRCSAFNQDLGTVAAGGTVGAVHALDRPRPHARGQLPRRRAAALVDALLGQPGRTWSVWFATTTPPRCRPRPRWTSGCTTTPSPRPAAAPRASTTPGICALALRQAFGGTELVDRGGAPWAFLKEISSDGNMSTIDVTYPAFPAYLYLSPGLPAAAPGAAARLRRARRLAEGVRRARPRHPATRTRPGTTTATRRTCRSRSRPTC